MDNSDWPEWLHQAWNGQRFYCGTLQRIDMRSPLPDELEIVTSHGARRVAWDDWIIRNSLGELYVFPADRFAQLYEPETVSVSEWYGVAA